MQLGATVADHEEKHMHECERGNENVLLPKASCMHSLILGFLFPLKNPWPNTKHPVDKMEWIHNQAAAFIRFVLYRKRVFLIARKCLVQKLPLNDKPSYHIIIIIIIII